MAKLWLSHHHEGDEDRCVTLGNVAVCRRCAVLYPVALLTVVLASGGVRWPVSLDRRLLWLLPIPAVLDFLADTLGARHRPRRQVLSTVALAVAMGVAWLRTRENLGDGLVWSVVATYGLVCVASLWASGFGRGQRHDPVPAGNAGTTLDCDDGLRGDRRPVGSGADLGRR